jgi:hypothetical protein
MRKIALTITVLAGALAFCGSALAQGIELPCPPGYGVLPGGQTFNSVTGNFRQWLCVSDLTGDVLVQTSAAGTFPSSDPCFDVKNLFFGAKANTKTVLDAVSTVSSGIVTSATAGFVAADKGKVAWVINPAFNSLVINTSTILSVNSATSVTLSNTASGSASSLLLIWGSDDTVNIIAAVNAAKVGGGVVCVPSGKYIISSRPFFLDGSNSVAIWGAGAGDGTNLGTTGIGVTVFFPTPTFNYLGDGLGQFLETQASGAGRNDVKDVSFQGFNIPLGLTNKIAVRLGGAGRTENLSVINWAACTTFAACGSTNVAIQVASDNMTMFSPNVTGGQQHISLFVQSLRTDIFAPTLSGSSEIQYFSNENQQRIFGGRISGGSNGFSGVQIDQAAGTPGNDIHFFGTEIQASTGLPAVVINTNAVEVKFTGGSIGPLADSGSPPGNATGIKVNAGGKVSIEQVRLSSTGTGFDLDNAGTILDLGGNTIDRTRLNGTPPQSTATQRAQVNLTAQGAAIGATTLLAVPATEPGTYRACFSAKVTQAATTSSTLGGANGFQIIYTDRDDSIVVTTIAAFPFNSTAANLALNTTQAQENGCIDINAKLSTNIQYQMGYTSSGATPMQYNLRIRLELLP